MIRVREADLHDQAGMERAFRQYYLDVQKNCPGSLNDLLGGGLVTCSFSGRSVVLFSETKPWMANPGGIVHGGVTAAYLDLVMGLVCRYFSGGRMTRTIHVDVNYLRAVPIGSPICFGARVVKPGSGICFAEGQLWLREEPDRWLASASGAYSVQQAE